METYGVGMIGFGFIGRVHALAHKALPLFFDPPPAKTRLVGVCTTSEASGIKAMGQADFEFHTTDFHALLSREDIRIVHICTPNDAHYAAFEMRLQPASTSIATSRSPTMPWRRRNWRRLPAALRWSTR